MENICTLGFFEGTVAEIQPHLQTANFYILKDIESNGTEWRCKAKRAYSPAAHMGKKTLVAALGYADKSIKLDASSFTLLLTMARQLS